MPVSHLLLALVVVAVWGTNFVVIKFGLGEFPPLMFATLRFFISCLPWVFFLRRPQVPWRYLAANGFLIGFGMFGLLFIAMRHDISPGLASLVVQTQAFYTIVLAALLLRERVRAFQVAGLLLCAAGIAMLFVHVDANTTALGLCLTLGSGLSWAIANLVVKRAGKVDAFAFMAWSCLFAVPPLLIASLVFEGPARIVDAFAHASVGGWLACLWQGVGNTVFAFGVWNWLLARYPAATVSPLSLLVPVFGMATAAIVYGEPMPAWKFEAGVLVLIGLAIITLWPRLSAHFARTSEPSS